MGKHASHTQICKRLARIAGHLGGVKNMIEEGRPCMDVLHQMEAVLASLRTARKVFLEDHLTHCVVESAKNGKSHSAIKEIKASLKEIL
jgi:DNA-binding FrmR family transcriptional regulator